jgi:hypothetical protein
VAEAASPERAADRRRERLRPVREPDVSRYVTLLGAGGGVAAEVVITDGIGAPMIALRTDCGRVALITGLKRDEVQFSPDSARVLAARLVAYADAAEAAEAVTAC